MKSEARAIRFIEIIFLAFFGFNLSFVPFLHAQNDYWVPTNPPKCHYVIDGRIDLEKGFIEGKEKIILKNDAKAALSVIALDWSISSDSSIEISVSDQNLPLLNPKKGSSVSAPLFYQLPKTLRSGAKVEIEVAFKQSFEFSSLNTEFKTTRFYPRLWWDGLPVHDSYSVKLDIPEGFALAISGRLNEKTGRYENEGARTLGIYLGKNQKKESREVEGVLVTTLFTEKGARCAAVCMETAVDAIKFYKDWLGFYPFKFLYIIPGGKGRWGGYPFATGIVIIHGQETFKEGESLLWWQWITAHEIGHEYWGEWVLDPDKPAWLWIGMGIFADTEYLIARKIDPERRTKWMSDYIQGISMYYDTTVDIPPARLSKIKYDHNNTIIHSKGFSIISALDSVIGRDTFERIYKKALKVYGGKRLSWQEFQRFCEVERGENLGWFFDQWVRSNNYLCYRIESEESRKEGAGYLSIIRVKRLGSMKMPVMVKAVFEDGTEQMKFTDRNLELSVLRLKSQAKLKKAILNPEKKIAMLENPLPEISDEAAELLSLGWKAEESREVYLRVREESIENSDIWYRLGMYLYDGEDFPEAFDCFKRVNTLHSDGVTKFAALGWMGLLKDLLGEREQALIHYKEALKYDTGEPMGHYSLRINMDRKWLEERLKEPFTMESKIDIPPQPTAEQLIKIVEELNYKREGKTPFLIYEKTKNLNIEKYDFWFKLGLLLFDSGFYKESFLAFEKVFKLESPELYKFASLTWMGHLKDLEGQREEAVKYYKQALERDTGNSMQHSQYRMRINRKWIEQRLKTPFTWKRK
ncbi:MAG: hypothetical protein AB1410_06995 [Acidobacteriota bacterium]